MPDPFAPIADGPTEPNDLSDEDFHAIYGPVASQTPASVKELLGDAPFRWWVVGGWAIELATQVTRPHDDLDVGVFVEDLPLLRRWAADRALHVWLPHPEGIRPLLAGERCPEDREQVWLRHDATQPWLLDLLLNPIDGDRWVFKKDHRISLPLDRALRVDPSGVSYLAPEVVLLHKAHLLRDKDDDDFTATVPGLEPSAVRWLRDALETAYHEHPWIGRL